MKRKPSSGQCIYCLKQVDDLTWDHVFPKSWYPKATDRDLEKWTVPACVDCNSRYGKNEKELIEKIGLCISPKDPTYGGIGRKAQRAISPNHGHNEKDARHRLLKRKKIKDEALFFLEVPSYGILPGFGPQKNIDRPLATVKISEKSIKLLGYKLIRGLTFVLDKRVIKQDYKIEIFIPDERKIRDLIREMERLGTKYYRGPGFEFTRAVAADNEFAQLFMIKILGRLRIHAAIYPRIDEI